MYYIIFNQFKYYKHLIRQIKNGNINWTLHFAHFSLKIYHKQMLFLYNSTSLFFTGKK